MSIQDFGKTPAQRIKEHARGWWPEIIGTLAPHAQEAINNLPSHVSCPIHGGTDGFRLFDDFEETGGGVCNTCGSFSDGFALLGWLNSWTFPETLKAVSAYLHNGVVTESSYTPPAFDTSKEHKSGITQQEKRQLKKRIRDEWDLAKELAKNAPNAVTEYLTNRGLGDILHQNPPQNLGFRPSSKYWQDGKVTGIYPVMIAAVRNSAGGLVSVHRTYLTPDGYKAEVENPKKLMRSPEKGILAGAAVQLYEPANCLCVAEGIETALAIRIATGLPVWATLTANNMARLNVPDSVREVHIYADNDASYVGQQAANTLAQRMHAKGKNVRIAVPTKSGQDFLDMLNEG